MAKFYVTAAMLKRRGACRQQVEQFRTLFGNGRVPVNVASVRRAREAGLDYLWPVRAVWWTGIRSPICDEAARLHRKASYMSWFSVMDDHAAVDLMERAAGLWAQLPKGSR